MARGLFDPMPNLNKREHRRDELFVQQNSSRDLGLQNKMIEIQIKKKIQFHIKVNQGREERIGRDNPISTGKLQIQINRLYTEQQN
ncbi:MAG: hypothetical protein EZS28_040135, partial [Streblomastix strix]